MGAGPLSQPFCSVGFRPPLIGTPVRGKGCEVRPPRIATKGRDPAALPGVAVSRKLR
jgi:hypothetical protein